MVYEFGLLIIWDGSRPFTFRTFITKKERNIYIYILFFGCCCCFFCLFLCFCFFGRFFAGFLSGLYGWVIFFIIDSFSTVIIAILNNFC